MCAQPERCERKGSISLTPREVCPNRRLPFELLNRLLRDCGGVPDQDDLPDQGTDVLRFTVGPHIRIGFGPTALSGICG